MRSKFCFRIIGVLLVLSMLVVAVPSILLAADVTPAETTAMMQAAETWLLSKQVPVVRDGSGNYVSGGYWTDNRQSDDFASTCFYRLQYQFYWLPELHQ